MRLIQAEGKNMEALNRVLKVKEEYGYGVSTLVLLYNATGDTLELTNKWLGQKELPLGEKDWLGSDEVLKSSETFHNGQWLAFLHAHPKAEAYGSEAARVYRCKNIEGETRDFMVAWSTPWGKTQNSAYTEVREKDHFPAHFGYIKKNLLEKANKISRDESDKDFTSAVSIGGVTSPEFIGILQHKFSPLTE